MVDTETRAERKAKRFPGRLIWVVKDNHGIDHCLVACAIKGKRVKPAKLEHVEALKVYEPETRKISTCRNGANGWKMD